MCVHDLSNEHTARFAGQNSFFTIDSLSRDVAAASVSAVSQVIIKVWAVFESISESCWITVTTLEYRCYFPTHSSHVLLDQRRC